MEQKEKSQTDRVQRNENKGDHANNIISAIIGAVLGAALGAMATGCVETLWIIPHQMQATKAMEQEAIVQALSNRFTIVDQDDDYEEAIEKIYEGYKDLEQTTSTISELNKQINALESDTANNSAVDRAKEYAEKGDYNLAIDALSGVATPTPEVETLLGRYEEKAASQLWSDVRKLIQDGQYDSASELIENYGYQLPQGYDIEELKKEVRETQPIPISDLREIDAKNWSVNEGRPIDNFGNEHKSTYTSLIYNDNEFWSSTNEHYVEYKSYKRYKRLTGVISPYDDINGATVRIILDGKTVDTYEVDYKTDPISFTYDISDVDLIRFEVDLRTTSGVIISDVQITK